MRSRCLLFIVHTECMVDFWYFARVYVPDLFTVHCSHVNIGQRSQYHSNEMEIITNVKKIVNNHEIFSLFLYVYTFPVYSERNELARRAIDILIHVSWHQSLVHDTWKIITFFLDCFFFFFILVFSQSVRFSQRQKIFVLICQIDRTTLKCSRDSFILWNLFSIIWFNFVFVCGLFFFISWDLFCIFCIIISTGRATVWTYICGKWANCDRKMKWILKCFRLASAVQSY